MAATRGNSQRHSATAPISMLRKTRNALLYLCGHETDAYVSHDGAKNDRRGGNLPTATTAVLINPDNGMKFSWAMHGKMVAAFIALSTRATRGCA